MTGSRRSKIESLKVSRIRDCWDRSGWPVKGRLRECKALLVPEQRMQLSGTPLRLSHAGRAQRSLAWQPDRLRGI